MRRSAPLLAFLVCAASCGFATVTSAQTPPAMTLPDPNDPPHDGVEGRFMSGKIGNAPIVLYADIKDHRQIEGGHYSYAKYQKKIPLKGSVNGANVKFTEPGGGRFELHFDLNVKDPSFYNTTGLVGTWTDGKKSLPVSLSYEGYLGDDDDSDYYPAGYPHAGEKSRPDQRILMGCIKKSVSEKVALACVGEATSECQTTVLRQDMCNGATIESLNDEARKRIEARHFKSSLQSYQIAKARIEKVCHKQNDADSPEGEGEWDKSVDYGNCVSGKTLAYMHKNAI